MSRDFVIITDSACDLSKEMVENLDIKVAPMSVTIEDKSYKHYPDCRELAIKDFYQKLRDGHMGTTACANTMDIMDTMRVSLEEGLDVLYLSFSSGMSSSYQSAVLAAKTLEEDFPDSKIIVVDTLCGSIGLGMITYLAVKRKKIGDTIHQVVDYVNKYKKNICHYFMVDDLKFIQKSGRISHISSIFGTVLNIKPIFKLCNEGKISLAEKVRGRKMAITRMIENLERTCMMKDVIFICHADAEDSVNLLKNKILEKYPEAEIHSSDVGPIVGNNTGPGTIAVIFFGSER